MFETTFEFKIFIMLKDRQLRLYTVFIKIYVFQALFVPFLGQNWVVYKKFCKIKNIGKIIDRLEYVKLT